MNRLEICLLVCVCLFMLAYYYRIGYRKYSLLYAILAIPVFVFSLYMLTEAVTADEGQYMTAFVDIRNLRDYFDDTKLSYEYRTSQMIFGTLFLLIPKAVTRVIGELRLYKVFHYGVFFLVILLISGVWRNKILQKDTDSAKFRLIDSGILFGLLALPVGCLVLKVSNYDASNIYFAILGFSLLVAAEKTNDILWAYLGTAVMCFGCMDKWTCLIYWCVAVAFLAYLVARRYDYEKVYIRLLRMVGSIAAAMGTALLISLLNILYLHALAGGGNYDRVSWGIVTFPVTYMCRIAFTGEQVINYGGGEVYSPGATAVLLIEFLMILAAALVLLALEQLRKKKPQLFNRCLISANAVVLLVVLALGIWAAYCVPECIAPYKPVPEGLYQCGDSFMGLVYHYGASSRLGDFVNKTAYAYATILCSYPTVVLLLLALSVYAMLKHGKNTTGTDSPAVLWGLNLICMLFPLIFVIADMPPGARYYGVTIFMMYITCLYSLYVSGISIARRKVWMCAAACAVVAEMALFLPQYGIFSPLWLVHSREYKQSVRAGEIHAGESLTWGEDLAVAGNMIRDMVKSEGKYTESDITIYSDYGEQWLRQGDMTVQYLYRSHSGDYKWDDTEYFLINRMMLYREAVPQFLYDVEPVALIRYNGELSTWIYRGDQLRGYSEWFPK